MPHVRPENLSNINPIVGTLLRIARKHQGISKTEFGKHLNLSADEIRQCETGQRSLQAHELFAASQILNVRTDYFFIPLTDPERIERLLWGKQGNVVGFSVSKAS